VRNKNAGVFIYPASNDTMQDRQDKIISTFGLKRKESGKYIVSYGGGVNSTALVIFLVKNKLPLDYVVFADTGDEMPETYDYLKHMEQFCIEHKIIFRIVKVRRGNSLSEKCLRRKVIPSQMWRWCTRDMKVLPIHTFYRSLKTHVYQYMGIDYDEVHRMKDPKVDYVTNIYPLIDYKIGRNECIELIKNAGMPVPVKSGCFFCPFNNVNRWAEIYKTHPELYKFAIKIEENGKHMPKQTLAPKGYTLRKLEKVMKKHQQLPMIQIDSPCGSECMV
jgi:3'-phosphoadenosine 5'-phosphosulfate sulfotransferase (PAPS reductase)/FAD synthetase